MNLERSAHRLKLGILATIVIAVLVIWMTTALSISNAQRDVIDHEHIIATKLSVTLAEEIQVTLNDLAGDMTSVAGRIVEQGDKIDVYKIRNEIQRISPQTSAVLFIAPDGRLASTTLGPHPKPVDMSEREQFRIHLDRLFKGIFVGKPVTSRLASQTLIPITMRVAGKDGQFLGVLVFEIKPTVLTMLRKSVDLGPHGYIELVGLDNVLLAGFSGNSPNETKGIGETVTLNPTLMKPAGEDKGFIIRRSLVDNERNIISAQRISGYPLIVTVALDFDQAMVAVNANARTLLGLVGLVTMLLLGLVIYLMREINNRTAKEQALDAVNIELEASKEALEVALAKAEEVNQAKTLFLANMSHELRTPLNAVIGFSQMIKDQALGPVNQKVYVDYAKDINCAGEHLLEIINSVLDISCIEVGKITLKEERIDTSDLVQSALSAVRVQANNKSIKLNRRLPMEPAILRADPLRLRQILINLLANAVKFTPKDGHVTISFEVTPTTAIFTVTDTGIGMLPKDISAATKPFHQLENALVKRYDGVGLGLSLAKQMTEIHGGTLEIESQKDIGTTVRVILSAERILAMSKSVAAA